MVTTTTKLFKRTSTKDVFDAVNGDGSAADPELADLKDADRQDTDGYEQEPASNTTDAALEIPSADAPADPDPEEGSPEESDDAQPAPAAQRRRRWRYLAAGAAAVIFVAALSFSGLLYWQSAQRTAVDRASAAASSSAQDFAVALTSMDSAKVDDNFNKVVTGATGSFKDAYTQSANQLRQILIDNKATSKGTVIDSAVKSATKDQVEVLLFVDQWITNAANPQPRLDRSRVAVTMDLVDGRWLASDVELK